MISVQAQQEILALQKQCEDITNQPLTAESRAKFNHNLSKISLLKSGQLSDEVRRANAKALAQECGIDVSETSQTPEQKGFRSYMRDGAKGKSYRTYSGMSVATDSAGGYIVPQGMASKIVSMMARTDALFQDGLATVFTSDHGNAVNAPVVSDEGNAAVIVGEGVTGVGVNPVFGQRLLPKAPTWRSGLLYASQELIEDSGFPIEDLISKLVAIRFRRGISSANIATLISQSVSGYTSGASGTVSLTDCAELLGSIDNDYASSPSFRFLMAQSTLTSLLLLKDSSGRFQSVIQSTADGYTLFGKKIAISPSCPAVSAGSVGSILAGDLSFWAQRIVKGSLTLLKYEDAPGALEIGAVGYQAFIRTNGGLMKAGSDSPVKYMTVSS